VHHDDVAAQQLDRILISGADFAKSVLGRNLRIKRFWSKLDLYICIYSKIYR
jgi:hypothetical protein